MLKRVIPRHDIQKTFLKFVIEQFVPFIMMNNLSNVWKNCYWSVKVKPRINMLIQRFKIHLFSFSFLFCFILNLQTN